MNIVICGAGEVGRHAAEVLSAKSNSITIIDLDESKLAQLDEALDVRSMVGDGTHPSVLNDVGVAGCDLFVAATNVDSVNLLAASVAKRLGAEQTIARVHHSAYFERHSFDYGLHLGIDHLVCPENSTALDIASALRSPGALAVERFAQGRIEMQRLTVSDDSKAIGLPLMELKLPGQARLCAIERNGQAMLPEARSVLQQGDVVTLVGDAGDFSRVREVFNTAKVGRSSVIIIGGTAQSVWLCRALHSPFFSIRLFEPDADRAETLAEKLPWVTVLAADAVNSDALVEERVDQVDVFAALTEDDETNILVAARAKSMGARTAIAVLQRGTYLHLLEHVGIDKAFSPRVAAVTEIQRLIHQGTVRLLASLAEGVADVFEVHVSPKADAVIDKPLREVTFPARCIVAAIQRGRDEVFVPSADSHLEPGDTVVIIGPAQIQKDLRKAFG
ncbi:MAG: Trk system potassium transporter TrkA [Phycisphaeraceae bacterium]|nr:Trk system potassium transporter TrkA [Phycisphaeraceae bacterium]